MRIILLSYYERGEHMDFMTELAAIAKECGGIIETKIAAQHGISKAMLYTHHRPMDGGRQEDASETAAYSQEGV